jgi:hypothetical protein
MQERRENGLTRPNARVYPFASPEVFSTSGGVVLRKSATISIFLAFSIFAGSIHGHHATPLKVDRKNPVTLRGTVKEFLLRNPHATLFIDVKADDGKIVSWTLEGGPVRGFILSGFTESTLPSGQAVTVCAYPSVTGGPQGQLLSIVLPDGKKYGVSPKLQP